MLKGCVTTKLTLTECSESKPSLTECVPQAGGRVLFNGIWRVCGVLGVSRAIGDRIFKPNIVTCQPEVSISSRTFRINVLTFQHRR